MGWLQGHAWGFLVLPAAAAVPLVSAPSFVARTGG